LTAKGTATQTACSIGDKNPHDSAKAREKLGEGGREIRLPQLGTRRPAIWVSGGEKK